MNRRKFLCLLGASVPAATVTPLVYCNSNPCDGGLSETLQALNDATERYVIEQENVLFNVLNKKLVAKENNQ